MPLRTALAVTQVTSFFISIVKWVKNTIFFLFLFIPETPEVWFPCVCAK